MVHFGVYWHLNFTSKVRAFPTLMASFWGLTLPNLWRWYQNRHQLTSRKKDLRLRLSFGLGCHLRCMSTCSSVMVCHGSHWDVWTPEFHIGSMDFLCVVYINLDSLISMANFWGMTLLSSMIMYQSRYHAFDLDYHLRYMGTCLT